MQGNRLRRGIDAGRCSCNLIEARRGPRVEVVAGELANQVRVDVEWRRQLHTRTVENAILGAPFEQVVGEHAIPRPVEQLRMKVEREPKWSLQHPSSHAAMPGSRVTRGLEEIDGGAKVAGAHEQVDVRHRPLARIVVKPVLQERALDRHHLNARLGEPPCHVADELGGEHRCRCPAPIGASVYCGLRHFVILSDPGIKQTASVV